MTSDIALAFALPEERAKATSSEALPDRISLRDYVVEADIGAFQQERGQKQRLRFNVVLEIQPHPEPLADDVDRILSYDRITEAITAGLADERLNLLETLAERVAELILIEPQALRAFIRIEKLDRGPGALGVEIVRAKGEIALSADTAVVHPQIVLLENKTIASEALARLIDAYEAKGQPLILAVGLPEAAVPQTGERSTQRRVDLLAMEQNAWLLAARDRRCVVVESRTEIDWAIKQGHTIVWAPSKMVLDAIEGPLSHTPLALAEWLGREMRAEAVERA